MKVTINNKESNFKLFKFEVTVESLEELQAIINQLTPIYEEIENVSSFEMFVPINPDFHDEVIMKIYSPLYDIFQEQINK